MYIDSMTIIIYIIIYYTTMADVWEADATANRLNATYITDFLDISGGNLNIRTPYNLVTTTGTVNFNRNTTFAKPYTNDISLNGRLFVGGDVSMGDISLNINGNLSIVGTLSVGTYKPSSISLAAIASAGGGGGGGYTVNANDTTFALDMSYNNKIQMNNDVSLNLPVSSYATAMDPIFDDVNLFGGYANNIKQKWQDIEISSTGQYQIAVVGGNFINTNGGLGDTLTKFDTSGNVWISNNYGNTWSEIVVGGSRKMWISAMISADGSIMMVKGKDNLLYRSTNYGADGSWSQIQFTFADLLTYSGWAGMPGIQMKMAYNGLNMATYYRTDSNTSNPSCRVITSINGGTAWIDISNNTDGKIASINASKSGQYIIVTYTNSKLPAYSSDYGASFITLSNGPISGAVTNQEYTSVSTISNNGKICIVYQSANNIFVADITTGTVTGSTNNAAFTQFVRSNYGNTFGLSSSNDGKYIVYQGLRDFLPGKVSFGQMSSNYGATFTDISGPVLLSLYTSAQNATNNVSRAWSTRFSADNKYAVTVKEFDYIYVKKNLVPTSTTLSAGTSLNLNGNITFNDGSTINSYNNNLDFSGNITPSLTSIATNGYNGSQYPVSVSYDGKYIVFPNASAVATSLSVSTNYGISVATRTTPAQCTNVGISGNGKIIIADCGGLYRSTDIGVSLTAILPAVTMGATVISLSYTGQYGIIVSQLSGIIYVTNDYGLSWTNTGLTLSTVAPVRGVVSGNGKYMYAVGSAVGYISSNYGSSFTSSPANSYGSMNQLSISYTGQYMARQDSTNTYYYSGDFGGTWASVTSGGTWGNCMSSDGKYRFALFNNTTVYCSSDYGSTWQSLGRLTGSSGIVYITCTSNGQNLYIRDSATIKRFTIPFKNSTFTNMTVIGSFASNPQQSVSSDYRIKTNVQTLDETHVLDKLRPVTYYQTQIARKDIGFIAHELQEQYPELVEGEKDGDKMQSINYNGILALLINEVQRLKEDIKQTKAVIAAKKVAAA
jgi:hypothetical protein